MDKLHKVVKRDQREKKSYKFLRITLITFCLVICILAMNRRPSFAYIGLDLAKPIGEAKCIQWQIQTQKPYRVSVSLKDAHSRSLTICFDTEKDDGYNNDGTNIKITIGIGDEYRGNMIRTYRSRPFADLVLQWLSGNDSTSFTFDDNTQITYIEIDGDDYRFYSLALYDDYNSNYPTWERNASSWKNLDDFLADGGRGNFRSIGNTVDLQFNASNIRVITKYALTSASEPVYPTVIRSNDSANSPYYTNPVSYQNYFPQLTYPSYSALLSYQSYSPVSYQNYFPQLTYPSYSPLLSYQSYSPLSSYPSYSPQGWVMSVPFL